MSPTTINGAAAEQGTIASHEPGIVNPLGVIAWLSLAATVLALGIAAALSLMIWGIAG
jgi:hypothetical protein